MILTLISNQLRFWNKNFSWKPPNDDRNLGNKILHKGFHHSSSTTFKTPWCTMQ